MTKRRRRRGFGPKRGARPGRSWSGPQTHKRAPYAALSHTTAPKPPAHAGKPPTPARQPRRPQHDSHVTARQLECRIERQIAQFTDANFREAFKKLHARRDSVLDHEIFGRLTKDFWPRVRYVVRQSGADTVDARLSRAFYRRIVRFWESNPGGPGLGIIQSQVGGKWVVGGAPAGKYRS